jgi:hypothetical protein
LFLLVSAARSQTPAQLEGHDIDYVTTGQECIEQQCQSKTHPGRIHFLKNGKILVYFADPQGNGLTTNGVVFDIGRSVNLSSHGRLPAEIGGIKPTRATGLAKFAGGRLTLTLHLIGSGVVNRNTADVNMTAVDIFEFDLSSGKLLSGSGASSGAVKVADGQGQVVVRTISSKMEARPSS